MLIAIYPEDLLKLAAIHLIQAKHFLFVSKTVRHNDMEWLALLFISGMVLKEVQSSICMRIMMRKAICEIHDLRIVVLA